eukprot:1053284_1
MDAHLVTKWNVMRRISTHRTPHLYVLEEEQHPPEKASNHHPKHKNDITEELQSKQAPTLQSVRVENLHDNTFKSDRKHSLRTGQIMIYAMARTGNGIRNDWNGHINENRSKQTMEKRL